MSFYPMGTDPRVYEQLHEASAEITRLQAALRAIYDVPWTSSGRGDIRHVEQLAIALAEKDGIARTALQIDEPGDNDA